MGKSFKLIPELAFHSGNDVVSQNDFLIKGSYGRFHHGEVILPDQSQSDTIYLVTMDNNTQDDLS